MRRCYFHAMPPRPFTAVSHLAVIGCLGLGVGACGGESKDSGSDLSGAPPTSFVELLRHVPDTAEVRGAPVWFGSFDRARNGSTSDSGEDDLQLVFDGSGGALFSPRALRELVEPGFAEAAGFDSRDVTVTLEYGILPDAVSVIAGDMSAEDMETALAASPGGESLDTRSENGITWLSLGDDDTSLSDRSVLRPAGEPLRLAVGNRVLVWSRSAEVTSASTAAASGDVASLADDAGYLGVASALDAAAVHTAIVVAPRNGESWALAGLGEAFEDSVVTVTIALHYADAASATAAAEALRAHVLTADMANTGEPWADRIQVTDTVVQGTTLVVTIAGASPGFAVDTIMRVENLLQF